MYGGIIINICEIFLSSGIHQMALKLRGNVITFSRFILSRFTLYSTHRQHASAVCNQRTPICLSEFICRISISTWQNRQHDGATTGALAVICYFRDISQLKGCLEHHPTLVAVIASTWRKPAATSRTGPSMATRPNFLWGTVVSRRPSCALLGSPQENSRPSEIVLYPVLT